jgi:hypothetical protein
MTPGPTVGGVSSDATSDPTGGVPDGAPPADPPADRSDPAGHPAPAAAREDPIAPDSKDWTWVLDQRCPDCGFDAAAITGRAVPAIVRDALRRWPAVLSRPDVSVRPDPQTWSALEYGCHARDVFRRFDARVALMREEDDPQFENWDQDATAIADRYGEQDPARVAVELVAAGEQIAATFEAVAPREWQRTGRRSNGSMFTIDSLGRYFAHDVVHHLVDVGATEPR